MIEELSGDFFQQLRGFYYTAHTGSIRKAAQLMNRNPSTISWQIRQLEQQLNTVLFDRYMKRLRITPEGERAFPHLPKAPPYEGAKDYFLVEDVDNSDFLAQIVRTIWNSLPESKPKTRRKSDGL